MFIKKPRYRRFEYEPRYYNPDGDPGERLKQKMRIERGKHKRKRRPIILWGILFILVLYVYLYLMKVFR